MVARPPTINGTPVSVNNEAAILAMPGVTDVLGVTGPKYGCALDVCKACTCHINGKALNPCSIRISDTQPADEITAIEGLPATVSADLHPEHVRPLQIHGYHLGPKPETANNAPVYCRINAAVW